MNQESTSEERAFEALIVQSLAQSQKEEVRIEEIRTPNEKERAALRMVKAGFLQRLVRGDVVASRDDADGDEATFVSETAGGALYRCQGVGEETERELEKADREIIERRKKNSRG